MAARKEIEKAVKFKEFQRTIDKLLTPEDRDYLFYAMKEYNTYKSVSKLMLALNSCLDTPKKLDLLPYIRDLIPKHDKKRFDNLAPYSKMAHPVTFEQPGIRDGLSEADNSVRVVNLQRSRGTPLGFSIRGGQEHELGLYVSHIESFSPAEKARLQVGDKIIRVNGIDFERVSHSSAVLVLKSHDNLKIEVKSTGKIPGQTLNRSSFIWIDVNGKPVDGSTKRSRHSLSRDEKSPNRLLSSADKHKIVLHISKKRSLGFSIRGGSEYGLGIYISTVDPGSPSEEAGLQVGDQILDINGHSFLNILHFEAVHILRSYDTLIMTIKSLGRIPALPKEEENGAIAIADSPVLQRKASELSPGTQKRSSELSPASKKRSSELSPASKKRSSELSPASKKRSSELSPVTRRRSSSARNSKRPSSATIQEEEEPEEEEEEKVATDSPSTTTNLKRSESERRSRDSNSQGVDSVDYARTSRSNSFGSGFSQRPQNQKKRQMVVSPLATHEARASGSSPSPVSSPDAGGPLKIKSKFFERGLGTQVMLASMTSQAKQLLYDKARRVLSEEDVEILKEDIEQYEDSGDIRQFVDCLISIFNMPEKMELLNDIRSIVHPSDMGRFDEMISPHQLKALRERLSESDSDDDIFDYGMNTAEDLDSEDDVVLTGIQHNNSGLLYHQKSQFSGDREKSASVNLRDKYTSLTPKNNSQMRSSAPELYEVQTKETNLSWYDSEDSDAETHARQNGSREKNKIAMTKLNTRPHGHPVIIDIDKEASHIGLAIKITPDNCVLVKDVRPDGAIAKDGFIKPGFEIVQVDNTRIRGKSYHDAAREIADAFKSDGPTVQFLVIPNYA